MFEEILGSFGVGYALAFGVVLIASFLRDNSGR